MCPIFKEVLHFACDLKCLLPKDGYFHRLNELLLACNLLRAWQFRCFHWEKKFFKSAIWTIFYINSYPLLSVQALQWRYNGCDGVSNHQPYDCLLNRFYWRGSKKTSKHRVTGLCEGNSPVTGEFPAQRASNAKNVFIWWRHHATGT